jgi:hypothetical protein
MEGRMGQWLSVGTVAFMLLLFLSVLSVIALAVCWVILAPESEDGDITPGGKVLLRARGLFTAACGLILISLLLDVLVRNPASPSDDWWIWSEHPRVLILVLILSSGLSIAASYNAFRSKGEGRWILRGVAPSMAALSLIGAIGLSQSM